MELHAEVTNKTGPETDFGGGCGSGRRASHNTMSYISERVLIITPGDREEVFLAAAHEVAGTAREGLAGEFVAGRLLSAARAMFSRCARHAVPFGCAG